MQWQFISPDVPASLKQLKQILLDNRKIEDAKKFFTPTKPTKLTLEQVGLDEEQVQIAIKRIKLAIKNRESVVIFGDYDADGICATAILWRSLRAAGLDTQPFIPQRDKHGYGLSIGAVEELQNTVQPSLIISVDNGIVAHDAANFAAKQNIDLIITDHHQPEFDMDQQVIYPHAKAIVHSTKLCGASVAWILARELAPKSADKTLDLAGLATIADQVPLRNANRSFAFHGLVTLKKSKNVGLQSLAEAAQINLNEADSGTVGFVLAPRINAMGRLAHGIDALRLLCTDNKKAAQKLATLLASTNLDRQDMTVDQFNLAIQQAAEQKSRSIIFVASAHFHEGVVGLIAGRLSERFSKPAIAVSMQAEQGKGSARSIEGVNIVELIREVRDDLIDVGGHPMAAGFGVALDKIDQIKDKLFSLAEERIDPNLLKRTLKLESALPLHLITEETAEMINKFAPFGATNPQPMFGISGVKLISYQTIGQNQKHLKLLLGSAGKEEIKPITALYWGNGHLTEHLEQEMELAVAARIEINEWRGRKSVQLVVRDIQATQT